MIPFNSNRPPAYETHNRSHSGSRIGIVTPSPHISDFPIAENTVYVNVGNISLCPSAWGPFPENFSPLRLGESSDFRLEQVNRYPWPCDPWSDGKISDSGIGEKLIPSSDTHKDVKRSGGKGQVWNDHPEDDDPGECDPGWPPEDI